MDLGSEPRPEPGARRVCAVLVTYNPDPALLEQVVEAATQQVDDLLLIDNGSDERSLASVQSAGARYANQTPGRASVTVRVFGQNRGLPAAFNEAIDFARRAGDQFLLLLDHDSILAPDAVSSLLQGYGLLAPQGAIGAVEAFNEEPATLPTDDFLEGYLRRHAVPLPGGITEEFLPTNSGLMIPLDVVARVGRFDESFFVDAVDFEFGLRVRAHGWKIFRIPSARVVHRRGEPAEARVGAFRWRLRRVAPQRHYYVGRETIRLAARYGRQFPLIGLFLISMPLREAGLVVLFYPNKVTQLRALSQGVLHAVTGVRGAYTFT